MLSVSLTAIPPLLAALLIIINGFFIFFKNPRSQTHRSLLYFCISLFIWLVGYTFMYCSPEAEDALKFAKFGFVGIAFIALTNFYFNLSLLKVSVKKSFIWFLFFVSTLLASLGQTSLIYKDVKLFFWGYYPQAGPLYTAFMFYYIGTWFYGLKLLYTKMQEMKASKDYLSYNQTKYVFIAWLGGSIGIVDFIPKYGIPIYPFAYLIALYWVIICSFAITRYKLLIDISFLSRRILIASGIFATASAIFWISLTVLTSISAEFFPINRNLIIITVSAGTGFILQSIFSKIKNLIDKTFFPEYFQRKEELALLGHKILLSKDSIEFNRVILESIFNLFKINKVLMYVWDEKGKSFKLKALSGWPQTSKLDDEISSTNELARVMKRGDHILLDDARSDFSSSYDQRSLVLSMLKMESSLCMPILSQKKLLGFLVLGDKESGLPYSNEDTRTLSILSDHIAFALENLDLNKRWTEELIQKKQIHDVLHKYMSPTIADEVLSKVSQSNEWKGEKKYVTILMADLRGFTNVAENHSPEDIVQWLNEYLSEMVEIILSFGGTIDKFMGDGVLVVFGAPNPIKFHELNAVKCALEMQNKLKQLNNEKIKLNKIPLQMGIAITAGDVISGNIGSDKRMEFTVIGDAVNLAARLQAIANPGQILATINVVLNYKEILHTDLESIKIRGKNKPVDFVEIKGIKEDPGIKQLKQHNSEN